MAILTVTVLKQSFDAERVTALASDYSDVQEQPVYDETIVQAIIDQAEAYVKAQLGKMYSTAELEADKSIVRVVADVTMYYLEFRRNQISGDVKSAFERAQRFLVGLQDGTFKLSAVSQLLPDGETNEPTEVLEAGEGLFYLTENERDLLNTSL